MSAVQWLVCKVQQGLSFKFDFSTLNLILRQIFVKNFDFSCFFFFGRSIGSLQGSTRSRRGFSLPQWQGPSSLHALYNLLLAPFEDLLPNSSSGKRKENYQNNL